MALSANSRLLLPQPLTGVAAQAGVLQGTISLKVQGVEGGALGLIIEQLGLYGPGVATEHGPTGTMSITGIPSYGSPLDPLAANQWKIDLPLSASVLYEAVERLRGFEKSTDRLIPATETFSGSLRGVLRESARVPDNFFFEGSLSLDYQSGGLGWIRHLDLPFASSQFLRVPAPSLGAELYRLRVQAVGFSDDPGDPSPSGQGVWWQQFQRAAAVWGDFGVQLDLVENRLHVVKNPALKMETDPKKIRLGWTNPDKDVVEFFFSSGELSDGGGITLSCGSALASVVLTDQQPHPDLLAHEIGHVLNGVHPGAKPYPGEWVGEPGSIMEVPVLGKPASVLLRPDTLFRNAVLAVIQPTFLSAKVTSPRLAGRGRQSSGIQAAKPSRKPPVRSGRPET